jgi:hypothetical protein
VATVRTPGNNGACVTVQPGPTGSAWMEAGFRRIIRCQEVREQSPSGARARGGTAGGRTNDSCTSSQPASNWLCVNGGWVPPDHPLAAGGGSGGGTGRGTGVGTGTGTGTPNTPPTTSCTTAQPASTSICINGGWGRPITRSRAEVSSSLLTRSWSGNPIHPEASSMYAELPLQRRHTWIAAEQVELRASEP